MENKRSEKLRTDMPSGRQTAHQPEHASKEPDPSTLHQGQGPDFATQDEQFREENQGIQQLGRKPVSRSSRISDQEPMHAPETIQKQGKNVDSHTDDGE